MGGGAKNIVIIHYQPLEMFPPVLNSIDFFSENSGDQYALHVFTTATDSIKSFYVNKHANIIRSTQGFKKWGGIGTILRFLFFTVNALFKLIKLKPAAIYYYESHSALPVYLYKKYVNKRVRILIHYHEYMSPEEYRQKGMRVINYAHSKERYLYTVAEWISHTNGERMKMFLIDNPSIKRDICHIAPNFPSRKWAVAAKDQRNFNQIYKLVYVGSFGSFDDLYIREVLQWVKKNRGTVSLDIYSFNMPQHISNYIEELKADNIQVKGAVKYDSLPLVLKEYNIGLIMYKATSLNVKYCAPNKLFEYLACGLDVWFPEDMLGCYEYINSESFPKVIKINFRELDRFDVKTAANRNGIKERETDFYNEEVMKPLAKKLFALPG
jgi:hypothetical protein